VTDSAVPSPARPATRVCLISEMIFPDAIGGLEIHAYGVAQRLVRLGLPVAVLTRYQRPDLPAHESIGGIPFVRIRPIGLQKGRGFRAVGPMLLMLATVTVWLLLHRRDFDVVLVHGIKVLSLPTALLSSLGILPCVIKVDSPMEIWEEISGESLRRMGKTGASWLLAASHRLRRYVVGRADGFIAISGEIFDGLRQIGVPPGRISCIPNGVDTERFHPVDAATRDRLRARLGLPADRLVVNFTGRLARSKGVPMLLEVWRGLAAEGRPLHLVLVGSGWQSFDDCEPELRAFIAKHGLGATVSLPGAVANVEEWLQASDVFVFPSDYEGLPLALLEAMATGLPTIATRVGAVGEVVCDRENGLLIAPGNPGELEAALRWIVSHQAGWPELGAAARSTVLEHFSLDAVGARYAAVLQEVGARGPRARGR
jgi:glycosyltransferase involved in cell wall biosynthesis